MQRWKQRVSKREVSSKTPLHYTVPARLVSTELEKVLLEGVVAWGEGGNRFSLENMSD